MAQNKVRVSVRVTEDDYEILKYWAKRKECSISDYLKMCIDTMIKRENGDFDVPNLMIATVNQLNDRITSLYSRFDSLESVTTDGFKSLIGLTRGSSDYLIYEDDGEI